MYVNSFMSSQKGKKIEANLFFLGTVDANEAITLSLVTPGPASNITAVDTFKPKFTYPIFGEEERIFGYKGLKINLAFDARDFRPNFSVSSSRKFTSVGEVEALDVKETMKEYLPGGAFTF